MVVVHTTVVVSIKSPTGSMVTKTSVKNVKRMKRKECKKDNSETKTTGREPIKIGEDGKVDMNLSYTDVCKLFNLSSES